MAFKQALDYSKMPGHWVLASLGKRVLRPGGMALTRQMLRNISITNQDDVVEFAPGVGTTARITLEQKPQTYTAVEQDEEAATLVSGYLKGAGQRCITGSADKTGLDDQSASVVYGEAMLTMLSDRQKSGTMAEAHRILRKNGRYGIHEMCLVPEDLSDEFKSTIQKELSAVIRVNARPLTIHEWKERLTEAGFHVAAQSTAPMHLLRFGRLISDEGIGGTLRIVFNCIVRASARKRVLAMYKVFRKYQKHLGAISLVGEKR